MKNFGIAVLTMAFAISTATMAQAPLRGNINGTGKSVKKEMKQDVRKQITAKQRAGYMAVDYELTDAQRTKLEALFEKQDKQREVQRAEMQKLREQQIAKVEANRKANTSEMEKIMGTEKYAQLQAKQNQRNERMKDGRKGNKMRPGMRNNQAGMRQNCVQPMCIDSMSKTKK